MIKRHVKHKRGTVNKDGAALWKRPALHHFLKTVSPAEFVHIEEVHDEEPSAHLNGAATAPVLEHSSAHARRSRAVSAHKKSGVKTEASATENKASRVSFPPLVYMKYSAELDFDAHLRALKAAVAGSAPGSDAAGGAGVKAEGGGKRHSEELDF